MEKEKKNEALEKSIAHWVENRNKVEDNVGALIGDYNNGVCKVGDTVVDISEEACALCSWYKTHEARPCDGCPVYNKSQITFCRLTPYERVRTLLADQKGKAITIDHVDAFNKQVLFLKSCHPVLEAPRVCDDCAYRDEEVCDAERGEDKSLRKPGQDCSLHRVDFSNCSLSLVARVQDRRITRVVRGWDSTTVRATSPQWDEVCVKLKGSPKTRQMVRSLLSIMSDQPGEKQPEPTERACATCEHGGRGGYDPLSSRCNTCYSYNKWSDEPEPKQDTAKAKDACTGCAHYMTHYEQGVDSTPVCYNAQCPAYNKQSLLHQPVCDHRTQAVNKTERVRLDAVKQFTSHPQCVDSYKWIGKKNGNEAWVIYQLVRDLIPPYNNSTS